MEIKSETQKIKGSSSRVKPINTYSVGHGKTKFEVELEQQQNRVAVRSQNDDSYAYSLDYLRYERDKQENDRRKREKEQSEASQRKIQSLDREYSSLEAMYIYRDLSRDEKQNIESRMKQIEIDRNRERLQSLGSIGGDSKSWEWRWER
ncbi:hypothetical protein [Providencia huaxiensis]|uniref:hypothetical protein n=2 Tax=Morganellaceae TaxID=1903414 RepID=UPI0034DDB67C